MNASVGGLHAAVAAGKAGETNAISETAISAVKTVCFSSEVL